MEAPVSTATNEAAIVLPFLGKTDASATSPFLFTVILAALDSVNPVAFFVLSFLLGLLINEKSRGRTLLIGGTFVLVSGLIYFIFIAAWLNVFLIAGHLRIITISAGIAALVVGALTIKSYFTDGDGENFLSAKRSGNGIMARTMRLLQSKRTFPMVIGAGLLAIAVNTYEMVSSLGFPLVFTRGLTLFKLSTLGYYTYLLLYCIVYVLPMVAIVVIFAIYLGVRKVRSWQGKSLNLTSGFMMFGLGLVLVFKPDLLNSTTTAAELLGVAIAAAAVVVFLINNVRPDSEKP